MNRDDAVRSRRRSALVACALLVLVALVYLPGALRNGLSIDDERFILENPFVVRPDGWRGWLRFLYDPHTTDPVSAFGIVRPLRTMEFALDYALFDLAPAAFHLHSLLWHGAATVLCFLLLERLCGRTPAAAVAAAIWALHPMYVESVAWISGRGDVAVGACVFGALLLELRSAGRDRALAASLAVGAVALLYKETAVVLPLLVFAVRLVRPRSGAPRRVLPALRAAVPHALLVAVYLVYRSSVQVGATSHMGSVMMGGGVAGTFSTMFRGLGVYLTQTVLPARSDYDWYLPTTTSLVVPSALAWLGVVIALVVAAVHLRRRQPLLAAAIGFFFFPLIPVANWPFQLGIPTTERFLYLPLFGLALAVTAAAARVGRARRRPLLAAAAAAAIAMGVISHVESRDWRDVAATMRSALRHGTSPRSFSYRAAQRRERGLALLLRATGAENAGERAQAARLRDAAQDAFASSLADSHRCLELWERFERRAHSTSDVVMEPHTNAANAALFLGRSGEALWHADRAIAAHENLMHQPHYNRAGALNALGRHAEAVASIARAFELGAARDDATMVRLALESAAACTQAGAFDAAARAYALVRAQRPEAASIGLAQIEDAQRRARATPPAPQESAARLAAVGAEVPDALLAGVRDPALRDFVLGCRAERRGDDPSALRHLARAVAEGRLAEPWRTRAAGAIERIRAGCEAWFDQSPGAARR